MYKVKGVDGQEYGPATPEQVQQWIAERRANAQTLAQWEGTLEWKPLAAFPEFMAALEQAGPSTMPAIPGPLPQSGPQTIPRNNAMAITGIVLGAFSLTGGWMCCCGFPASILGLIFSGIALSQASNNPLSSSRTQALIGLVLSFLGLCAGIILPMILGMAKQNRMFSW